MKRRQLLQAGLFGAGITLIPSASFGREKILRRTPTDFEGPFYPVKPYAVGDGNLLAVKSENRGDVLTFTGQVKNEFGDLVPGAIVDIWHTDPIGRYDHPADRRPGKRFEDFAYFAKMRTDDEGRYSFRTYIPGDYGSRPEHIHFKVWQDDQTVLTSQIYFRERGGAKGASKYRGLEERKLVNLTPQDDGSFVSEFLVVI